MKKITVSIISGLVFVFCVNIIFAGYVQGSTAQQYNSGVQQSEIVDFKKQLELMNETIKMQQEMINALKNKIETEEVQVPQSSVSVIEVDEIEQVIDSYMMKEDTKEKMASAGLVPQIAAYWDNGLRFESWDGNFKLKVGGRINNDWFFMDEEDDIKNAIGDQVDSTEQRRVRFYMAGTIYENIGYKLSFDWEGGSANLKDAYMELKKVPLFGNIRVGQMKEPFNLEMMNSGKYITFLERGLNNAFVPKRNTGLRVYNHALEKRLSWSTGIFRNDDDFGNSEGNRRTEGGYSISGRVTGLSWYEDGGAKLIHTGISYSHQNAFAEGTEETGFRFSSRPEVHNADKFVDTGRFAADSANLYNPELAIVYGPFSFQSEYTFTDVNLKRDTEPNPHFSGYYVYGSYFLTGEHRKYKRGKGRFGRLTPDKNFSWERGKGKGAIELAARYSELDLSDQGVNGGRMQDTTLGVNWYLNPNTRVTMNYVHSNVDRLVDTTQLDSDGADMVAIRFYIDF